MSESRAGDPQKEQVETWLQQARLCNLHRHITGSLSTQFLADQYRQNDLAASDFRARFSLDPTHPEQIRALIAASLAQVEDGWRHFENAFNPGRILLDNDPQRIFHRRAFRQVVLESAAQSIALVGIRASLGSHRRDQEEFAAVLQAAMEGILQGEEASCGSVSARLILGVRKDATPAAARDALRFLLHVRQEWKQTQPEMAARLYGLDSIGPEGSFDPAVVKSIYQDAARQGLAIFNHIGETWEDGQLVAKLHQVRRLVADLPVNALTNPVALFVDYDSLDTRFYTREDIRQLHALRDEILASAAARSIALEISPTSNDLLTRRKRKFEGWQFAPLKDIILTGAFVLITDDDGSIFDTDIGGEFRKLNDGSTPYGLIEPDTLRQLILNAQNRDHWM